LKVALSEFAALPPGTIEPDQFTEVAHVLEVPPIHVPSAAFAVGTEEKTSPMMAALTAKKEFRMNFIVKLFLLSDPAMTLFNFLLILFGLLRATNVQTKDSFAIAQIAFI
jgi:hypothetical protein